MKTILLQLDTDPQPSVFDRVVAVDAGVDQLFVHGGVTVDNVEPLVHGLMFTRGGENLKNSAIFIGGSQVAAGEALLKKVKKTFFGPVRVSVLMDSNGSNTTAAAAVLSARRHLALKGCRATVLAATGPVGQRAAQILASEGAHVHVGSRGLDRATQACEAIAREVPGAQLTPMAAGTVEEVRQACHGASLVIAAGAAGIELLPESVRRELKDLKVAIDLNAVPPAGIGGIAVHEKGVDHAGVLCYGAIGVGGLKMKIHKAAVQKLFTANDQVLDTAAIYQLGLALV